MNLLEQQAANRRRTWLVMAAFVAFVALLGAGVDVFLFGQGPVFVPFGTLAALALGGGQAWWGLRSGDRSVLASAAAVPVTDRIAQATTDEDRLRFSDIRDHCSRFVPSSGYHACSGFGRHGYRSLSARMAEIAR